jgi:hypothetical protein
MLIGSTLKVLPSGSWHLSVTESVVLPPAMRECVCLMLNSPTSFLHGKSSAPAARFAMLTWRLCGSHPAGPDSSTGHFGARSVGSSAKCKLLQIRSIPAPYAGLAES